MLSNDSAMNYLLVSVLLKDLLNNDYDYDNENYYRFF